MYGFNSGLSIIFHLSIYIYPYASAILSQLVSYIIRKYALSTLFFFMAVLAILDFRSQKMGSLTQLFRTKPWCHRSFFFPSYSNKYCRFNLQHTSQIWQLVYLTTIIMIQVNITLCLEYCETLLLSLFASTFAPGPLQTIFHTVARVGLYHSLALNRSMAFHHI